MNKTIGKLNILVGCDVSGVEKNIKKAEKIVAGFSAHVNSLPKSILGGFGGIAGQISNGINEAVKSVGDIASQLPGGENWAKKAGLLDFANWGKSAESGIDKMQELGRISKFHGVSPQFAQMLELATGDGPTAVSIIDRVGMAMAKIQQNDKGMTDALSPFLDIERFANSGIEGGIRQIADALGGMNDQVARIGFAESIVGAKKAGELIGVLGQGQGKLNNIGRVLSEEGGLVGDIEDVNSIQKYIKLKDKAEQVALDLDRAGRSTARSMLDKKYNEGDMSWGNYWHRRIQLFGDWMEGGDMHKGYIRSWANAEKIATGGGTSATPEPTAHDFAEANRRRLAAANAAHWESETAKMAAGLLSPEEQFLREAFKIGLSGLDDQQANKALDKAFQQSYGVDAAIASARQQLTGNTRSPSLALAGSQEYFAAIDAAFGQKDETKEDTKKIAELAAKNLEDQKKAIEQRDDIIRRLRENTTPVTVQLPP